MIHDGQRRGPEVVEAKYSWRVYQTRSNMLYSLTKKKKRKKVLFQVSWEILYSRWVFLESRKKFMAAINCIELVGGSHERCLNSKERVSQGSLLGKGYLGFGQRDTDHLMWRWGRIVRSPSSSQPIELGRKIIIGWWTYRGPLQDFIRTDPKGANI